MNDKATAILLFVILAFVLTNGFFIVQLSNSSENSNRCEQGITRERIIKVEPTSDPNISIEAQYYLIECSDGNVSRVKTNQNFPIGVEIQKVWRSK